MQNHHGSFTEQKQHHCLAATINNETLIFTQNSIDADRKFGNCEFTNIIVFLKGMKPIGIRVYREGEDVDDLKMESFDYYYYFYMNERKRDTGRRSSRKNWVKIEG